jgi:uncharacterized membrane protein
MTMSDTVHELLEAERELIRVLRERGTADRPAPVQVMDANLTLGQRLADRVAALAGSWTFLLTFCAGLVAWTIWNGTQGRAAPDPYPFILLNLLLSCVAALQAPVIMMSQNRQAARDRFQVELDYQINVKAELEIADLRGQLEELRRRQWSTLMALQKEQIALLREIADERRETREAR